MTRAVVYDISAGADVENALTVAQAALSRGEVVWARVHGVGCLIADAFSVQGVTALLQARTRGRGAGLPVLVRDSSVVHALFADVNADALALMAAHWPGPLTLLGTPTASLKWDIGAAGELVAVAVTMADSQFVTDLVSSVGPCVYLQAHSDSHVQEKADEARSRMADLVSVYVQLPEPQPSESAQAGQGQSTRLPTSIVDVRSTPAVLVRAGAISATQIRVTCPGLVEPDSVTPPQ